MGCVRETPRIKNKVSMVRVRETPPNIKKGKKKKEKKKKVTKKRPTWDVEEKLPT